MKKGLLFGFAILMTWGASAQHLTDYVDMMIGTGDHGHVFVGANVPFGMVQAGPTELQHGWDWCSGYHYSSDSIIGFSHLHLSGTGCGDLGDIALMPDLGDVTYSRRGLAHKFKHDDEVAEPGYYSVVLTPHNIKVELTATERVALHKYTYPKGQGRQSVTLDMENTVSTWDKTMDCRLLRLASCTFVGFRNSKGWAPEQSLSFAISFSRPISNVEMFDAKILGAKGKQYASFTWDDKYNDEPLMIKVALSPTSEVNALMNMREEMPEWDFETTRERALAAWEAQLSRVTATFPTEREARIFYTSMFHMMVAPQLWNDCNGDYMGADLRVHRATDYNHLTTWSLWDTYRAVHPLSTIIFSDRSRDYVKTMMDIFRQSGELPVWHLMSNDTYCMVGEPAVPVLADIVLKGQAAGEDIDEIFQAMKASLLPTDSTVTLPQLHRPYNYRGKEWLASLGYIPYDCGEKETVAKNLEYFLACWSAAQVAGRLGHEEDSVRLATIGENYRKLFDQRVGFIRALSSKGEFRPLDGFNPSYQTKDYTEGNPWQYTFLVPHDVDGLIELMGGKRAFEKKLDSLFLADEDLGAEGAVDVTGLIGQYAHGNEPSHHILYMYNYVGKPEKAQRYIRRVMDELYDDKPAGLCGNEDVGQMSAWYVMSALGFYQVEPSGGKYQLGSPAVRKASVDVGNGNVFTVKTYGRTEKGKVKRFKLNGKVLDRTFITHQEIVNGGLLEAYF